jgi:LmbE family N-acetylglucosaminyl deacetylase
MALKNKKIIVVSPHPDDETLGVGGFIKKLIEQDNAVKILTVSGHLPPLYESEDYELTVEEAKKAYGILGVEDYTFMEIPATFVRDEPVNNLNARISSYFQEFEPNIVLCPFPDRHIDHRVIFDSVMVASRPVNFGKDIELLAAYETLSETHWNAPYIEPNFNHNLIVDITEQIEAKLDALRLYKSQINETGGPRSIDAVRALAKFRGSQAGFSYGEALYVIRQTY